MALPESKPLKLANGNEQLQPLHALITLLFVITFHHETFIGLHKKCQEMLVEEYSWPRLKQSLECNISHKFPYKILLFACARRIARLHSVSSRLPPWLTIRGSDTKANRLMSLHYVPANTHNVSYRDPALILGLWKIHGLTTFLIGDCWSLSG